MVQPKRRWLNPLRLLAVLTAVALLAHVFSAADGERLSDLLSGVGLLGFALILVPQIAALSAESFGWKLAFQALGQDVRWSALLRVRVATEALAQSLPVGVAFSESLKPLLLHRHAGIGLAPSIAGMAARKYLLLLSQSVYVLALAALGLGALEAASKQLIRIPGLGYLSCGAGALLGLGALGIAVALRKSEVARGTFALLERLPFARLAAWLAEREKSFTATDSALSTFFRADFHKTARAALCFGAGWLLEAIETYLILRVLGVQVDFVTIASFEVVLSLVRNVVFVVPAGLGVQDLGYVACLSVLGVPDAASTGAAFVLLKRAKELFWILFGYALLLGDLAPLGAEGRARAQLRGAVIGDIAT